MGRVNGTTKSIINEYYKEKIKEKENERCELEQEYILKQIENFDIDEDVLKARKLLEKINNKYDLDLKIHLPRWKVKYTNSEEYNLKIEEIKQIKKERDVLLILLDYFPKNSKEYKDAVIRLNNIIKGE